MKIYLVRHTAVDVPAGIAYGQTDVPLRDTFAEEAEAVRQQLAQLSFDAVYTSPLSRCTRLADVCGYPDAICDERLLELNFGDWEMHTWDEVTADPQSKAWFEDWINVPVRGGESFRQQYERVARFFDDLKQTDHRQVCIFAHGGILTCARVYAGCYELKEAFNNVPPYGGVIDVEV